MRWGKRSALPRRWLAGLLSFAVSFLCILLVSACSQPTPNQTAANPAAPPQPILRVATDPTFAPFEFKTPDGKLTGFDIDLINAIGGTAGFIIDFREMPFDEIIRGLYTKQVDLAISAITITTDRADRVSFTRPYYQSGLAIAVQSGNTTLTTPATLANKRIGAQDGTTGAAKAGTIAGASVKTFTSAPEALKALAAGNLDAVINDAPATAYAISSGSIKGIKMLGTPLTEEYYGIATPKNSPTLDKINSGLSIVWTNGTYTQIYKKWFGTEPPRLTETIPL